jgi:hypothetical protein
MCDKVQRQAGANYACMTVIEAAPSANHYPSGDEEAFKRLAGATIVRIGSSPDAASPEAMLEGGGLFIDYKLPDSTATHRLVFGFNENGMWLVFDSLSEL